MTCLIVDDNEMARLTLRQLISNIGQLTIIGECTSAPEAFSLISRDSPDLVFLDIEITTQTTDHFHHLAKELCGGSF
jgi:two-component system LytT family response regulator